MNRFTHCVVLSLFLPGFIASVAGYSQSTIQSPPVAESNLPSPTLKADYGKLPLSFEANQGQSDGEVRFQSRGQGYSFFLTDSGATLALSSTPAKSTRAAADGLSHERKNSALEATKTDIVSMDFAGASPNPHISGEDMLPGKSNYFIGKDPNKWRKNVPTYAKVKYEGVYPGIDLVYYGNQQKLEYDFIVAPGADPKPVRLHFTGSAKLKLDKNGDLQIIAANGQVAFHKPVVYQNVAGRRVPVSGDYEMLASNNVRFQVGTYDHTQPLVIDPVLAYSTYFQEDVQAMAVDRAGNAYLTGLAFSPSLPTTTGSLAPVLSGSYAGGYVTKLDAAGSALVYSTYLDGTGAGNAIAVNAAGEVYVTGQASRSGLPVTSGAYQTSYGGSYILKLNAAGSELEYATYLGPQFTNAEALALDPNGNAFVTGWIIGGGLPVTSNAFQKTPSSDTSGFVTELNADGSALVYSTYLSGTDGETDGYAIAVDASDCAYITGTTDASGFPITANAFRKHNENKKKETAFVSKLNADGSALVFSTYLGGNGANTGGYGEQGRAISVDYLGNAYVTGLTDSSNFPTTPGVVQAEPPAGATNPGFVTKFSVGGSFAVYSTYLGNDDVQPNALVVDHAGRAYLTGYTDSKSFPTTPDAYQASPSAVYVPTFFTVLDADASNLAYSTYFGPGQARAIALDNLGNAYLGGDSAYDDPSSPLTAGAYDTNLLGSGFVAKFAFNGATTTTLTSSANPKPAGGSITFTAHVAPVEEGDVPVGTVTFRAGSQTPVRIEIDESGNAQYTTSSLPVGSNRVVAYYLGQSHKYAASSTELAQAVTGQVAAPTFSVPSGTHAISFAVSLATVTRGASIRYTLDGSTPTTSSSLYTAPIYITKTTVIKAIAADTGDSPSMVSTVTYTFSSSAVLTKTAIESSVNPSVVNQPITFTATVTPASGAAPTGSVIFKHGDTVMDTVTLTGGVATFTISSLPAKQYSVTATYMGSSTDAASKSPALLQVVNPQ